MTKSKKVNYIKILYNYLVVALQGVKLNFRIKLDKYQSLIFLILCTSIFHLKDVLLINRI